MDELSRIRRSYQDRRCHHRRGTDWLICCVRAGPARHENAPDRHSRQDRRTVRGALSGKADLRHSRHSLHQRPRPGRRAHGADQAVQSAISSQRDGGQGREDRRPAVPRDHGPGQGLRSAKSSSSPPAAARSSPSVRRSPASSPTKASRCSTPCARWMRSATSAFSSSAAATARSTGRSTWRRSPGI